MMDKWKIAFLYIIIVTLKLSHNAINAEETFSMIIGDNLEGANVCKKIDTYNVTVVVAETIPYQETKTEWCAAIPPRCRKTVLKFKQVNKTEVLPKTRAIRECCEGYKENEQRNRCIPHCQKSCGRGICISPDVCKCESGFGGPQCDVSCPPNYYGTKCRKKCDCANQAECDPYNGACHCKKGYQGTKCENICTPDTYGENCSEPCRCQNNGKCNHISGECYCQKGFTGPLCEEKCKNGKNNDECKSICRCQNGGICDEDSQTCKCPPGYTGAVCGNRCPINFYGVNCSQICECFNGASCDHITGKCICEAGFMGEKCLDTCPFDRWGQNCTEKCLCSNGATCDQASGVCHCAPGWSGVDCSERLCPENQYGENCTETCECVEENTESCHPYDGSCECKPGWSSLWCNRPCPFLKYGKSCGLQCDCKNNAQCMPQNGTCICPAGFTGEKCELSCPENTYGQGCSQRCECKNNAQCSPETGQCFCKDGFKGFLCDRPCDVNTFGPGCSKKCDCLNNGACHPVTGECYCSPGYTSEHCEKKCDAWKFGQNCSFECNCEVANTLACDHISGKCLCKTEYHGSQIIKYAGVRCESKCPLGFYGPDCHHQCNCKNNSSCDPVTGECFCERGWIGRSCDQKCPNNYYGQNCKEKCPENMPPKTTCDHVTGEFKCRPGYIGITCDHPCKAGTYGEECNHECKCDKGECHHVDGVCHCYPGWTGTFCSESCSEDTWGNNCQHKCNCANNAQCRKSDGICVCKPGFMGTKCEEVCPEGYFGDNCLQICNCNRRANFVCHPADGCKCKSGFRGDNCDESVFSASTSDPEDEFYTNIFASTTFNEDWTNYTELFTKSSTADDINLTSMISSATTLSSNSSVESTTSSKNSDISSTSSSVSINNIEVTTRFTFVPLNPTISNEKSEHNIESHDTTKFTFAPLEYSTLKIMNEKKNVKDIFTTVEKSTAFTFYPLEMTTKEPIKNDKTTIYAYEDVTREDKTFIRENFAPSTQTNKQDEEFFSSTTSSFDTSTTMDFRTTNIANIKRINSTILNPDNEDFLTTQTTAINEQASSTRIISENAITRILETNTEVNYEYSPTPFDSSNTANSIPITTTTNGDKLMQSITSIQSKEIDLAAKTTTTLEFITESPLDQGHATKSSTSSSTTETGVAEESSISTTINLEITKDYSPLSTHQVNVPNESYTTTMSTINMTNSQIYTAAATSIFDSEYLNDRNESQREIHKDAQKPQPPAISLKEIFHDSLINMTKVNDSKITEQMELKQNDDSSVSRSGMIWGIFCTFLFVGIIMAVLLYYRRRVANLKAEIGHVVRYMSDDPRNFDNPVYQYQPSVNTDTSTLLHRNGVMNNLRQTRPSNMDRLNNFDHDSNSSGRAAAYSLQYDSELMNQKNHDADMTNPNLYCSIDDHLYDEIKLKCADLDMEYDHLDYSRPQAPVSKHYHRATSSTMSNHSQRGGDRESNQSNNKFANNIENTYDAPIPHPKKLNISPVPPLPAKNIIHSNLTPSPSSSTASTMTQDDNIDAIISIDKAMHKDLNGKVDVTSDEQTDNHN